VRALQLGAPPDAFTAPGVSSGIARDGIYVDEIREQAQEVFHDVFGDTDLVLRDDMTADDVDGWDSTAHINLIVALEKHFGVKFAMAEISRMKDEDQNVGGLLQLIAKKLGRSG